MIVQKNFLLKLRDFGINTYESKLWTALLSRGSSTAGELSDIANVPRSRTYDVLESLEKKGFIIRKLGKPIKYIAVPPTQVVDAVKKKVKEESERRVKLMEELKGTDVLDELNSLHSQGAELVEPSELTGAITGRENLNHHVESRIAKATSTVSIMTTSEGIQRLNEFAPLFKRLRAKGVKVRIAAPLKKEMKEEIAEIEKYAEIRHTEIRGRFIVVDDAEVIVMLLDDRVVHPSFDTAVWINTKFFASFFSKVFEGKWGSMKPFASIK